MSWSWPQWVAILWVAAIAMDKYPGARALVGPFWALFGVITVQGFFLWVLWMGGFFAR